MAIFTPPSPKVLPHSPPFLVVAILFFFSVQPTGLPSVQPDPSSPLYPPKTQDFSVRMRIPFACLDTAFPLGNRVDFTSWTTKPFRRKGFAMFFSHGTVLKGSSCPIGGKLFPQNGKLFSSSPNSFGGCLLVESVGSVGHRCVSFWGPRSPPRTLPTFAVFWEQRSVFPVDFLTVFCGFSFLVTF